jgi:hypothetical protein
VFKDLIIMPTHTDLTKRFLDQADSLIKQGRIANYSQLADTLEWDRTSMVNVKKGRRQIPQAVYRKFAEMYGIAPEPEPSLGSTPRDQRIIEILESQIKDKDERIKLLLGYIDSLRDEIRELVLINQSIAVVSQDLLVEAVAVLRKQDRKKVAASTGIANYETLKRAKASGSLIGGGR